VYNVGSGGLPALGIHDDDLRFAVYPRAELKRVRLDSQSDADSYVRLHLEFSFLLSRSRPRRAGVHVRAMPLNAFYAVTAWFYWLVMKFTRTFPIRRADVQCAVELHKHWPDPKMEAMVFIREVRVIIVSRDHVTLDQSVAMINYVDAAVLQRLLPAYRAELDGTLEQAPRTPKRKRDRPIRVSLLADRIFAVGEEDIHIESDPSLETFIARKRERLWTRRLQLIREAVAYIPRPRRAPAAESAGDPDPEQPPTTTRDESS
jgi:hypothetical protein